MTNDRLTKIVSFAETNGLFCQDLAKNDLEINEDLLSLAHNKAYCEAILGSESQKEDALIKTFELFDDNGKANRFNRDLAELPLHTLSDRARKQTGASLYASIEALKGESTFFLGGGYHHAMSFGGRGFCHINDIIISAKFLQKHHRIGHIWVIDIDVHKGDGTAEITLNDDTITTFSIHMAEGWPLDDNGKSRAYMDRPWHLPSTVDIPVGADQNSDYLNLLEEGLKKLSKEPNPDFIFVIQGSDPYEKDELESSSLINLSLEEMLERDIQVLDLCQRMGVPHCHLMSGGYGKYSHEPFIRFFEYLNI